MTVMNRKRKRLEELRPEESRRREVRAERPVRTVCDRKGRAIRRNRLIEGRRIGGIKVAGKKETPAFSKQQFLNAAGFTPIQKDVLRVLMKDDETYTLKQAQLMMNEFAKRKVT